MYARTGVANYVIGHRKGTGGSAKGNVTVGLAEPFYAQGVEVMLGNARKNAERLECRQGERNTCLHGPHCRGVFRGREVVHSVVLREMSFSARKVLSHKASNRKLDQPGTPERRNVEDLSGRKAKFRKKLEAAKVSILSSGAYLRGNGQGTKRGTAEIKINSGSERWPNANGSPDVRSLTA